MRLEHQQPQIPRHKETTMRQALMNLETRTVTRRFVLGSGLAGAVASMVPPRTFAQLIASGVVPGDGDAHGLATNFANLYAFPGTQPKTTIVAATWPARMNRFDWNPQKQSEVTIHAGSQQWNVTLPDSVTHADLLEQRGCRVFAGTVATQPGPDGVVLKAVVIEIPDESLCGSGPIDIWAERTLHTCLRRRLGSPFVAALVADNANLAHLYHSTSPSDDRTILTKCLVKAIAAKAREAGMAGDPDAHARRLAARLLPDVLHYDPRSPSGFTFAAQNGRHPEELAGPVVDTILSGSPAVMSMRGDIRLHESFPFFSRHESVA
jgi:hypothetical protein